MSVGKYSPICPHASEPGWGAFRFNAYGKPPEPWNVEVEASGVAYDPKTMSDYYDDEGYDSYGYSAFDAYGQYVGIGEGVDRCGYTEHDYLLDSIDGGDLHATARFDYITRMKS